MAIWRIFRRSPLSEEKYPNRNPAWKQALLIIDFQGFTRKGSSTSLSALINENQRFTLVFLCPKPSQACLSEGIGHKKLQDAAGELVFKRFGTVPLRVLLSVAKKNPSHRSGWDLNYS
ncbi:hypothetical protein N9J67_00090 [Schleiferiaceae bacterium]|nr:hypothetical protein [Schleiferiaceae bacterium]